MSSSVTNSCTVLCKLVVSLRMQKRKTTDKIYEISIVPNLPNYSIVALHLHFAPDNQLAKPCNHSDANCIGFLIIMKPRTPCEISGLAVANSLEVVRPYCVVITTTPTFAYSLVQGRAGTAMAVPALRHASQNADSAYSFCIALDGKNGTLSQHFVTHVVPPLLYVGRYGRELSPVVCSFGDTSFTNDTFNVIKYSDNMRKHFLGVLDHLARAVA